MSKALSRVSRYYSTTRTGNLLAVVVLLRVFATQPWPRDPEQFAEPDQFNIHRTDNRHLAFAHGLHFCVGSPLALLEAEIALSALLQRFPQIHLEETERIEWKPIISRSLKRLPVAL